ncbi:MAG: Gfo/Idh/MocA family oxidoreductase [Phycisphaerales bacterium]|nr:Gfo/Idh/MocA family oxidoreductase [Phycisphaerales bacterium]
MKQVLQNLRSGVTEVAEVPGLMVGPGQVLIQSRCSLISAGSERMLVEFGKAGFIGKVRSQPDKVKQVLDKIKTDGLLPTMETVFARLDEPMPLGYCNAGVVLEVGAGVTEFAPGDRVVSNGSHAEMVCIPKNLCAKIPDGVSDAQAAFTVLSSIGLQGIRLLEPSFGERFVVYGLGLIGLVAVQLLRANGCEVLGIDINPDRLRQAEQYGAETCLAGGEGDPVTAAASWTLGRGVDGVLITAAAKTDAIMHEAAQMCRKRGRVVLVGVVGLNLRRPDFYEKEITFQVSCSYGPGRYDEKYEQGGQDYPFGFVRWTEQRNFEAVLLALQTGRLAVDELISHRLPLSEAARAYELISKDPDALGVILEYPREVERSRKISLPTASYSGTGRAITGVIGAGAFSKLFLAPCMAKTNARMKYVADLDAGAALHLARKHGGEHAVTDYRIILDDPEVNAVLIAVGHHLHARFVCEVLAAGKHVFVEKPLAMNINELSQILAAAAQKPDCTITVGFNRRFSPHTMKMAQILAGRNEPLSMNFTANAGIIPPDHWVQDPARGGGRIIGEVCHFIDLMAYLARSPIKTVAATMMGGPVAIHEDKMSIVLGFEDGSVGTVNYFGNGSKSYPKEMMEVFSEGRVLRLDNFRKTIGYGFKGFRHFKTMRLDKGHNAEFAAFAAGIAAGGSALIPLDQLVNATLASFAAVTAARENRMIVIKEEYAALFGELSSATT